MVTQEITSTLTQKGQVTIPIEVRRHLGLGTPDKVTFVIEDHGVHLKPSRSSVSSLFGSVPALNASGSVDFEDEIEEALEAEVGQPVHELNRG